MKEKDFHIIIPARYQSSRFPGKPLAEIFNKPMIQHVYDRARACEWVKTVTVATDDQRIFEAVEAFGGQVVYTSNKHLTGTDRIIEALNSSSIPINADTVLINLQGDEPFIKSSQIKSLCETCNLTNAPIATLAKAIEDVQDFLNPNIVKVVKSKHDKALYFSRAAIPFLRDSQQELPSKAFRHIGIYAFQTHILNQIGKLPPSDLELSEQLEQLRWLENGFEIYVSETDFQSPAVDTPEDLEKILQNRGLYI